MKVAVIGAGWAGLAASVHLLRQGLKPTVFEASGVAGGRARVVDDVNMGAIDNGQHLLVGAYTSTLDLIRQLHPDRTESEFLMRIPLHLECADGQFRMRAPAIAAPLHTLFALLSAQGLSIRDRWRALRMMLALKRSAWQAEPGLTVAQLLKRHAQSDQICRRLWIPLCLATLNTSDMQACAQLFLNVLRDTLDAPRQHSDLLIPLKDLTRVWPEQAAQLVDMRYRHIVRNVTVTAEQVWVDQEKFDACIVAIPPYATARVLQTESNHDALSSLLKTLEQFAYRSIATLTLQLDRTWHLPQPLLLLNEDHQRGHYGQWVFERTHAERPTQLAVVVSDAEDFLKHDRSAFVASITEQIREQCAARVNLTTMPEVVQHRLIVEKRATFAAIPGLARPTVQTPWARLFLAGDWTDTGYPAVLEGAVRSGETAAEKLLEADF